MTTVNGRIYSIFSYFTNLNANLIIGPKIKSIFFSFMYFSNFSKFPFFWIFENTFSLFSFLKYVGFFESFTQYLSASESSFGQWSYYLHIGIDFAIETSSCVKWVHLKLNIWSSSHAYNSDWQILITQISSYHFLEGLYNANVEIV